MCVCMSHRWLFRSTFSPWVYSLSLSQPPPAASASNVEGVVLNHSPNRPRHPVQAAVALVGSTLISHSSRNARPYSGCSGWVCRPFSGGGTLWCSQKALCSWSSSDIRGRPMSKCIFRFSSHSSSLEKGGLRYKKADFSFELCVIHSYCESFLAVFRPGVSNE